MNVIQDEKLKKIAEESILNMNGLEFIKLQSILTQTGDPNWYPEGNKSCKSPFLPLHSKQNQKI